MVNKFIVQKETQIAELVKRIPPILNVDVIVFRKIPEKKGCSIEYLFGKTSQCIRFPGSRMYFTESPQETAERVLKNEIPGIKAQLKKLATAVSDQGLDSRAYGVTLYFIFEYKEGTPKPNPAISEFYWKTVDEMEDVFEINKSIMGEVEATIRMMNTTDDEILVEVDKNNQEIGIIIKRTAHYSTDRYHRAAHIMIFTSNGDVVLQQRSFNKSKGAGLWDMHGGHQAAGQSIEQTAKQELAEELGIECKIKLFKTWLFSDKTQNEWCYVYYGINDGPYGFDRNEVESIKTFDCKKLLEGKYDQNFRFVEPFAKQYTQELQKIWEKLKKKKKRKLKNK